MSSGGSSFDENGMAVPGNEDRNWLGAFSDNELPYIESHVTYPGGVVHLVGAGPGSAGLITVLGHTLLNQADVIVHDSHLPSELLARSDPSRAPAELHAVDAEGGVQGDSGESSTGELLVRLAREGKLVVRLVEGDPLAFGRCTEEAQALVEADVPLSIVPGVESAFAMPGSAGIPLASDTLSAAVTVLDERVSGVVPPNLSAVAAVGGTIVLRGRGGFVRQVLADLSAAGMPGDVPATVLGVDRAQRVISGTVASVPGSMPATGEERLTVVAGWTNVLRDEIASSSSLPLAMKRVLLSGGEVVPGLSERLRFLGASVFQTPRSRVVPIEVAEHVDALDSLHEYEWLVFNSPHAVEIFQVRLRERSLDARALAHLTVAAAGADTVAALLRIGIVADVSTEFAGSGSFVEALQLREEIVGARVLLAGAQGLTGEVAQQLELHGVLIDELALYRVVPPAPEDAGHLADMLDAGDIDVLVFTSPESIVTLAALVGAERVRLAPAVVPDPETGAAIGALSEAVVREADTPDAPGVTAAIVATALATQQPEA